MKQRDLQALDQRLETYLLEMTASLGRSERRHCAGLYLRGLLLEGQRKSIEPLATRVGGSVQALQQFIGQSPWPAQPLHTALNQSMCALLGRGRYWVVDETAFPKQGTESVGVTRQYCGALGKIASCQIAVSLHWTDQELSWPLGWRLYLPEAWTSDQTLRAKAGVPDTGEGAAAPRWAEQALIEWPAGAAAPNKYWLCWQPEEPAELLELAQNAKARWKIEQDYRELKEELGLDHFEGRGWLGWHHHVALVTLAFAFLRREQFRAKKNFTTHLA